MKTLAAFIDALPAAAVPLTGIAAASFAAGYAASLWLSAKSIVNGRTVGAPAPPNSESDAPATTSKSTSSGKPTAAEIAAAEEQLWDNLEDSDIVPEEVDLKMVVCVRQDLNMSKGKIAAQVGHAVLGSYKLAKVVTPEFVKAWEFRAQAKITLKVDDEKQMNEIYAAARQAGLPCVVIEDAGRTEVEPGTHTVLGIGPAPKAEIDAITGLKGRFPLRLLA